MASITLSNLDSRHFKQLRISTDCNGCSMEEEARMILVHALNQNDCAKGLGTRINQRFRADGGVELELPSR
ncbi:FitA-like ribbon-helix-helix domain-containing protein [Pseudomonas sp. MDT1-16]